MNKILNKRMLALLLAVVVLIISLPFSLMSSAEDFISENIMLSGVKSITPVVRNITAGNVFEHTQFDGAGAVAVLNDGDTVSVKDVYGANDWGHNSGVLIELNESVFCSEVKIFSGFEAYPDTYDVYASDDLNSIYSDNSKIGSDIICMGAARKVSVDKKIKYLAVFLTDYTWNGRIAEIELWTGDESDVPEGFKEENLLRTELDASSGIIFDRNAKTAVENTKFDENGAIAGALDGDTVVHTDVYGWNSDTGVGVMFTLNDTYYCGRAVIYSGLTGYPDKWTVYASDSLETLYDAGNLVTFETTCENQKLEFPLNRKVTYISFIFASDGGRVKELELYSAENPDDNEFVSQNLLPDAVSRGIIFNRNDKTAAANSKFNENGAIAGALDGDISAHTDVYGWDSNTGVGVEFVLDSAVYCGKAVIYSGLAGYPDKWRVYASDSVDTLYSDNSLLISETVCENEKLEVDINKEIKVISFIFDSDGGRIKEFELWSAENPNGSGSEDDIPEYDTDVADGGKKVLTIGNSFSENASAYATDIAANQGYDLLFGYLKYPSCTIEQHIKNAERNSQVYKFEYTSSKGRVTVKDGINESASIKEALQFTDWDIVVLQEGSTASEDIRNYLNIGILIEYVKSILPDAEIMLHETWSWGTWGSLDDEDAENDHQRCYNIIANYIVASELLCDGAKVIHSGMAIETAREYYEDHYKFNETDGGNYQHLNELGKYIAGATFVATIFDCDITENTFGDGSQTFKELSLDDMRAIIDYIVNDGNNELLNTLKPLFDEIKNQYFSEPDNFIKKHFDSAAEIMQDVASGSFADGSRFALKEPDALQLAIDGDSTTPFEIYGALDWKYPKNVGAMYKLDASYNIDTVVIYAGLEENATVMDVYASDSVGTLYSPQSRIATGVKCTSNRVEIPLGKQISCVAFVITGYTDSAHVAEFDLIGAEKPVIKEEITWPEVPSGESLLKNAEVFKIIAPGGDFNGTKEFEYKLMEQQTEVDLSVLTDGKTDIHYDVWNLTEKDRPGVLYDLGAYYDISHFHAWAGADGSELIVNNGFKIYASESLADLYKKNNLVFDYTNANDTTNEVGLNKNLKRIRYVAFLLTNSSDMAWRMREFAVYGAKSADQTEKAEPTSIIEGIEAEYYGVATDNLADPIYMGASDFIAALTDGSRNNVEFWGGADIENSKFVFIYNLYANYDISGVDIYAFADSIEDDSGIHKGIKSAKVYASRKFEDLFNTSPVVMKSDYADSKTADENSYYSTEAPEEWKGVRYIAYVFTIGDFRYGACRLEELKAFGTLSAVQDVEEEEEKLPQYIDIKAENGVVARIFALNSNDDLTKLDAKLNASRLDGNEYLEFVNEALPGYEAESLHKVEIVDSSGNKVNTDGRLIRLSIPETSKGVLVACVDDFGAEIVSSGILNNCLTVETSTLRSYAIVKDSASQKTASSGGNIDIMWTLVIVLGVLSLGAVASSGVIAVKKGKE